MSSPTLRRAAFYLVLVASFSLALLPVSAQSTGGRILGRVSDSTGAVVTGVQVTLINDATGDSRDTKTDQSRDYKFAEVVPSKYRVEYSLQELKKNVSA